MPLSHGLSWGWRDGGGQCGNRETAIVLSKNRHVAGAVASRNITGRDIRVRYGPRSAQINRADCNASPSDQAGEISKLDSFRVEGSNDGNCWCGFHARQRVISASTCVRSTMPASDPSPPATSEAEAVPRCAQSVRLRPSASPAINPAV